MLIFFRARKIVFLPAMFFFFFFFFIIYMSAPYKIQVNVTDIPATYFNLKQNNGDCKYFLYKIKRS